MICRQLAAVAAAALTVVAVASPASARARLAVPTASFMPAANANYTVAHRPTSSIDLVVVHVTESSASSAISWFRNPRAQASANYVVSRTGRITQMVRDSDIAWHAGNWNVNRRSIGVEHEGYTYRTGSFTDTEYRASARLVAAEMRHYLLPIDRKHIIGHNQVPDPNHAGLFGGFAHHTDPGPHWNWNRYLDYVKSYARGGAPAPKVVVPRGAAKPKAQPTITAKVAKGGKIAVASSGLRDGATVAGFVRWQASVARGSATRVEFLVDGRLRWAKKDEPYRYGGDDGGWDTTRETNGAHVLTLRVVAKNGTTAGQSLRVTVANSPFEIAAAGLANGQAVEKQVRWEAVPSGAAADRVDFLVDGKLVHTEREAPYLYGDGGWDTTKTANGPHTLTLHAVAKDGRVAESSLSVVVANAATPPKPRPRGASIFMTGLGEGAVVSGRVDWQAKTSGPRPDHVEFWIDGRWRWTERSAPWVFNGDGGTWDTSAEQAGRHVVTVKAVMRDGSVSDQQSWTVTVQSRLVQETAPPPPTTMSVGSSLADGATVHGPVAWNATVAGAPAVRVDFSIDGTLRHTERSAPYEFGTWDTTKERNGAHTLVVKATAKDGTTATLTQTVQVANEVPELDVLSVGEAPDWVATTSGPAPERVDFLVDGRLRHTERSAPYEFSWDPDTEAPGDHVLLVRASGPDGLTAERSVTVTVAAPPEIALRVEQSLEDGGTVSGEVEWTATPSTGVRRVEFSIDGHRIFVARREPYTFELDSSRLPNGTYTFAVKAIARDGTTATAEVDVTVEN